MAKLESKYNREPSGKCDARFRYESRREIVVTLVKVCIHMDRRVMVMATKPLSQHAASSGNGKRSTETPTETPYRPGL